MDTPRIIWIGLLEKPNRAECSRTAPVCISAFGPGRFDLQEDIWNRGDECLILVCGSCFAAFENISKRRWDLDFEGNINAVGTLMKQFHGLFPLMYF